MGQALSTPEPALGVKEYINLPKEAIEALWYCFCSIIFSQYFSINNCITFV
jgi:hypothetical protein